MMSQALHKMLHAHLHTRSIATAIIIPSNTTSSAGPPLDSFSKHHQPLKFRPKCHKIIRNLQMQFTMLANQDTNHISQLLRPINKAQQSLELLDSNKSPRQVLHIVLGSLELEDLSVGERFQDGDVVDDGGGVAFSLKGEEGHWYNGIWNKGEGSENKGRGRKVEKGNGRRRQGNKWKRESE
ncbi:hypothetical protein Ancab_003865 [Ancistrocladus abbreviatus]